MQTLIEKKDDVVVMLWIAGIDEMSRCHPQIDQQVLPDAMDYAT